MSSVIRNLKLEQIRTDGDTQPRTALNDATVAEYAEAITEGAKLPPITTFYDGANYWLADGFHRFFAHKDIGALDIQVEVQQGTKRDAVLYSVGANSAHGLRRTNADKRKAVTTLLEDTEWSKWSDREIARQCGVSNMLVGDIRKSYLKELTDADESESSLTDTRTVERGGKTYEQDTTNIGKKKEPTTPSSKKQSRTLEVAPLPEEQQDESDDLAQAYDTIAELAAENDRLMDHVAVGQMDASDIAKVDAMEVMAELRERVKTLEAENDVLRSSRDTYMTKVGEMQRQINYWRRQAEKGVAA